MKNLTVTERCNVASLEELESFEQKHKICLPKDYKEFLLQVNPISVLETLFIKDNSEFWLSSFYPFNDSYEISFQVSYENLNEDCFEGKYVSFADDAGGWQFVISVQDLDYGKVYFCRLDVELEDGLTLLSNSFNEFIDGLRKPSNNEIT